jgi:hypothetical protein
MQDYSTFPVLRTPTPLILSDTADPSVNLSGTADPHPPKLLWYRGPPTVSSFLVPRSPTRLNLAGTKDPHPSQLLWYSTVDTTRLIFSGTADSHPSQPFWYCGPTPISTFMVLWTPKRLIFSGTADSHSSQPFCIGLRFLLQRGNKNVKKNA